MKKLLVGLFVFVLTAAPVFAANSGFAGRGVRANNEVIGTGRTTVPTAGTRVQLSATSVPCYQVMITAETDNTGVIVVGGASVVASLATRQGTPLTAGASLPVFIDDLSKLYLDATVSTDGVTYTYFR